MTIMNLIGLALVAVGLYVGVRVVMKVGGWLVSWARRAIRAAVDGARVGVLTLGANEGQINAYALGAPHAGDLQVVDEITVDEDQLSTEVLQALRRHGAISEQINVE
jgi:hypothetical protein